MVIDNALQNAGGQAPTDAQRGSHVCSAHLRRMKIWVGGNSGLNILIAWPGMKRGPYGSFVRGGAHCTGRSACATGVD